MSDIHNQREIENMQAEIDRLRAENAKMRAALKKIIALDDDWVPDAQDDYSYTGYIACADIARAALGGDK